CARQAGVQIIAPADRLKGVQLPALNGDHDVREALRQLLAGTSLEIASDNGQIITLRDKNSRFARTMPEPPPAPRAETRTAAAPVTPPSLFDPVDEIVVTGTRILRDGFQSPTPVTVLGQEAMDTAAPENVADLVNDLPSVVGSATPQSSNLQFSSGLAGLNTLNLRGIGSNRTLVLLDGQRSVPSTITGLVDVNDFPQQLINRIDVVTGGASAAYGSDALSGVVNFVLNKNFTGVKGEVSSGITTYGDDPSSKITLSAGSDFANGRGHMLMSGEWSRRAGTFGVPRDWNGDGWLIMNNPRYTPNNGEPQRLLVSGAGLSMATPGGIIVNTALRGIYFGPGGVPAQLHFGPLVSDPFMQGGDWKSTLMTDHSTLDQRITREGLFFRAAYDVSDDVRVFAQAQWGFAHSIGWALKQFNIGNIIVRADNAFIPASVAAQARALGLSQFTLGTNNIDLPTITFDNERTVNRYVVGLNGSFDAFAKPWEWAAYYQKGVSRTSENGHFVTAKTEFGMAVDAVRAPNGAIACRSTLSDPSNGCVPYNVFGIGVNSTAAIDYVFKHPEHPQRNQRFAQDVMALTVNGEPFEVPAGPVSLAFGAEHRLEKVSGRADPISLLNGWFAGNYLPTYGRYNVTEAFAETVVPLARNASFADSIELNAAVRATSYSTSGLVATWKIGASYQPGSDIRFRVTRSRDIRAPNLNDLFQAGTANTSNVTDPFNNGSVTTYQGLQVGNPLLEPEQADTTGVGIVFAPSLLRGFTASADYYNIDIRGGIQNVGAQTIVDRCFQGVTEFCSAITRGVSSTGGNVITQIRLQPFNFTAQTARGLDLEATYRIALERVSGALGGLLTFRVLATHYLKNYTDDGINPPYDTVGSNIGNGQPNWAYNGSIIYSNKPLTLVLTGRGVSKGVYSINNYPYIMCASGCPASTLAAPTINDNRIKGAFYFDAGAIYKIHAREQGPEVDLFLTVSNLLDKDPPVVATGPGGFPYAATPTNPGLYDVLGRMFRAGVRFNM
ncbi:MAG: TonB-dependent receptor, partial [Proteobacteria bacterium]|nr:TonB-dependent receptor [Pseudomonadota bacterium]